MKKIKEKVLEIVAIAKECPENLQQTCFEILLKHTLTVHQPPPPTVPPNAENAEMAEEPKKDPKSIVETTAKHQDDLSSADLHVKARRFLEKHDLSLDHLNQLFYKEHDEVLPLYDDLKTTRTTENQVRITLMQCLRNAVRNGDFQTTVDAAREEAIAKKCYDKNNLGNNYTDNAALFDFDKYTKSVSTISLSDQGKTELADLVKELQ